MYKLVKSRKGFTLIELVIAMAIMALVGSLIAFLITFCYNMYNTSKEATDAHNLAILTVQEIQNKVRYAKVIELSSPATLPTSATGAKYIYYDGTSGKKGLVFQDTSGSKVYYGSYSFYNSTVTFKLIKNNLLSVTIKISNQKGSLIENTTTQIMLLNVGSGLPTTADDTVLKYVDS